MIKIISRLDTCMATPLSSKHVLITGPPGIGKTTLIQKLYECLKKEGHTCSGFYTAEKRKMGQRIGFDVITLAGNKGTLAKVPENDGTPQGKKYTVGKYCVDLISFENTALPTLKIKSQHHNLFIIDEIGKMELFSQTFVKCVQDILESTNSTVLATVPIHKGKLSFVDQIKSRDDVVLYTISRENRDSVLEDIQQTVKNSIKKYGV